MKHIEQEMYYDLFHNGLVSTCVFRENVWTDVKDKKVSGIKVLNIKNGKEYVISIKEVEKEDEEVCKEMEDET